MLYEEDSQQSYKPTMYIPLKKVKEFSPTNARQRMMLAKIFKMTHIVDSCARGLYLKVDTISGPNFCTYINWVA